MSTEHHEPARTTGERTPVRRRAVRRIALAAATAVAAVTAIAAAPSPAQAVGPGTYRLLTQNGERAYRAFSPKGTYALDFWPRGGGIDQQWVFTPLRNGTFQITNIELGTCLRHSGDGRFPELVTCAARGDQMWLWEPRQNNGNGQLRGLGKSLGLYGYDNIELQRVG